MDFNYSERSTGLQDQVRAFLEAFQELERAESSSPVTATRRGSMRRRSSGWTSAA